MGAALQRTALSTNVKERLDFSCALFDAEGRLVANAAHIPVHLGRDGGMRALPARGRTRRPAARRGVRHERPVPRAAATCPTSPWSRPFSPAVDLLRPAFLHRQPRAPRGDRRHRPRFPAAGRPLSRGRRACSSARSATAPMPPRPATTPCAPCSCPARIPRVPRTKTSPTSTPRSPPTPTGAHLLHELIARHGLDTVTAYAAHLQRAAEGKMRAALARLPAGTRRFEDAMDDGTPITVSVTIAPGRHRHVRFYRQRPGSPRQPQCQPRHRRQRGHLLPALPVGRTHPAQCRSARAGAAHHPARHFARSLPAIPIPGAARPSAAATWKPASVSWM